MVRWGRDGEMGNKRGVCHRPHLGMRREIPVGVKRLGDFTSWGRLMRCHSRCHTLITEAKERKKSLAMETHLYTIAPTPPNIPRRDEDVGGRQTTGGMGPYERE
jgi:hypothetical protein